MSHDTRLDIEDRMTGRKSSVITFPESSVPTLLKPRVHYNNDDPVPCSCGCLVTPSTPSPTTTRTWGLFWFYCNDTHVGNIRNWTPPQCPPVGPAVNARRGKFSGRIVKFIHHKTIKHSLRLHGMADGCALPGPLRAFTEGKSRCMTTFRLKQLW